MNKYDNTKDVLAMQARINIEIAHCVLSSELNYHSGDHYNN